MALQTNVYVSKFLGLNTQDAIKAFILTVITSVLTIIYEAFVKCSTCPIDWQAVKTVAITTAIGYILKNWLSPTQIVIQKPSEKHVEAVKEGTAQVNISTTKSN